MGFMDYYKLQQVKADTSMRDNIGKLNLDNVKDTILPKKDK